jgi:signal peptidase I
LRVVLHIPPPRRVSVWRTLRGLALQAGLLLLLASALVIRAPQVSGFSMAPRIASGEYVIINTLAYRMGVPKRGDIIAFRHERSAPAVYLKRVIGLPGERVSVRRGIVSIDGRPLAENYVRFADRRSFADVTVPPDAYYVLGDNRANSDDSRSWGTVPAADVIGKAVLAVWPPSRVGIL